MARKMTQVMAANVWLQTYNQLREMNRLHDEAADILKEHFRRTKTTSYRGVMYAKSTFVGLNAAKVRALLGDRAVEAEETRTRETLSPAK